MFIYELTREAAIIKTKEYIIREIQEQQKAVQKAQHWYHASSTASTNNPRNTTRMTPKNQTKCLLSFLFNMAFCLTLGLICGFFGNSNVSKLRYRALLNGHLGRGATLNYSGSFRGSARYPNCVSNFLDRLFNPSTSWPHQRTSCWNTTHLQCSRGL